MDTFTRFRDAPVGVLGQAGFNSTVLDDSADGHLILFTAPGCSHCRRFMPTFSRFATRLAMAGEHSRVPRVWTYPIEHPAKDSIHGLVRVKGFPTVVYLRRGLYWKFEGQRELPQLHRWIEEVFAGGERDGLVFAERYSSELSADFHQAAVELKRLVRYNFRQHPYVSSGVGLALLASFGSVLWICCVIGHEVCFVSDEQIEASISGEAAPPSENGRSPDNDTSKKEK